MLHQQDEKLQLEKRRHGVQETELRPKSWKMGFIRVIVVGVGLGLGRGRAHLKFSERCHYDETESTPELSDCIEKMLTP